MRFLRRFWQDQVADRRHVRAEFRCRDVAGRRVIIERKLRKALAMRAGTFSPQMASRTNRRDVVCRPVTSILENFASFFFFLNQTPDFFLFDPVQSVRECVTGSDRDFEQVFFFEKNLLGPRTKPTLSMESPGEGEQL